MRPRNGVGEARRDAPDRGQFALGTGGDAAVAPGMPEDRRFDAALARAGEIAEADVAINRAIGEHGEGLIAEVGDVRAWPGGSMS